jgi:hypothetical protein
LPKLYKNPTNNDLTRFPSILGGELDTFAGGFTRAKEAIKQLRNGNFKYRKQKLPGHPG